MLYDTVALIIADLCLRAGTPVTVARIARTLGHLIEENILEAVCLRMVRERKLFPAVGGGYTVRTLRHRTVVSHTLISAEYEQLGMTLMETDHGNWIRCIPPQAEHRFLEVKPSTIGRDSGMGLFVRSTRRVPLGCVICEYRGRELTALPAKLAQGVYVVRVRNTGTYIDGVTYAFEHLSLATFINDNGPKMANAGMMEYTRYPGRVFVVANRDIAPGEEVFVLYGATYWGFTSYSELARQAEEQMQEQRRKQKEEEDAAERDASDHEQLALQRKRRRLSLTSSDSDAEADRAAEAYAQVLRDNLARHCRICGDVTMRRMAKLHNQYCGDPLVHRKLFRLECTPYNELTALDSAHAVAPWQRTRALHRAKTLVELSEPQTFSHTHQDVIGDLEFTFEEAEDDNSGEPPESPTTSGKGRSDK